MNQSGELHMLIVFKVDSYFLTCNNLSYQKNGNTYNTLQTATDCSRFYFDTLTLQYLLVLVDKIRLFSLKHILSKF